MFDTSVAAAGSFEQHLERVAGAFALTRGDRHMLVFANDAFSRLVAVAQPVASGAPPQELLALAQVTGLSAAMDRAFQSGQVARDVAVGSSGLGAVPLYCTIWPEVDARGRAERLVIELRVATKQEVVLDIQRDVAERLLVSALRDQGAAERSESLRQSAVFLAAEGRRLSMTLDGASTLSAIAAMSLPGVSAWCIVDTLDEGDSMQRVAALHPDPAKQAVLTRIDGKWMPSEHDAYGLPAALRDARSAVVVDASDGASVHGRANPDLLAAWRALEVGDALTVPMLVRERLIGAVTFLGRRDGPSFSPTDIALAEELASRSAVALDRARVYGEAVAQRRLAELASEAKSAFLGMMSHELRTPLNAIGGYAELIAMELHGPVTAQQQVDLTRIVSNQRYLMGLINDLLNLTKVGSGRMAYNTVTFDAPATMAAALALVEPLVAPRRLRTECDATGAPIRAQGDPERVLQILVNLLSNAIRFTPPEGELVLDCHANDGTVSIRVCDTGIGIPSDKLDDIFEPFVQVRSGLASHESGVGLGLAISRTLARDMHGDLTVESTLGEGARFTLTLPRSFDELPDSGLATPAT